MRLLVKLVLSGQTPLLVITDTLPSHCKRRIKHDPPYTGADGESTEERILLGLRVDRTDSDDHICIKAHPLSNENAMRLMRGEPQASHGSTRTEHHGRNVVNVGDDHSLAGCSAVPRQALGGRILASRYRTSDRDKCRHSRSVHQGEAGERKIDSR